MGVAGHVRPLEALFNEVQVVVESRVASKLRGVSTLEHLGLGGVEHKLMVRRTVTWIWLSTLSMMDQSPPPTYHAGGRQDGYGLLGGQLWG